MRTRSSFRFIPAAISEVLLIEPCVLPDERGFFMETYKRSELTAQGIDEAFVQCNQSQSAHGTLRGLHYQKNPKAQGKLVRALAGEIYDVAVDLRAGSLSFGKWVAAVLSAENRAMLYVPSGFAHGYCVLSGSADVLYMTTEEYAPSYEAGVIWDDPDLAIKWPISEPTLSPRDRVWPRLQDADNNFTWQRPMATVRGRQASPGTAGETEK